MKQPDSVAAAGRFPGGIYLVGGKRPRPRPTLSPQCNFCAANGDGKFPCGHPSGDEYHVECVRGALSVPSEPILVVVAMAKGSYTRQMMAESGVWAMSLLREDQQELASRFERPSGRNVEPEIGGAFRVGKTGSPILQDCAAWLDCRLVQEIQTDHGFLLLGRAVDGGVGPGKPMTRIADGPGGDSWNGFQPSNPPG